MKHVTSPRLLLVIVLMMLALMPLTVSADSMEGRLAYRKGDFAAAFREFGTGVQSGPVGSYFLALMYLRGEGVARNEARGLELLRISADEGYSAAQYLLGQRYYYGQGLPRDMGQAMSYLLAASADDDYRAHVLLKIIEKGSRGEKKDRENIVVTVKQKARSKVADAQYTLAFMYLIGDGVPKDGVEEVRWYRAAAAKNARAAFMLSLMYQYGEGIPKNTAEALRLMRIAAQQDDPRAQYYLGTFYYQGIGTQIDRQSAVAWFWKSAENGFAEAQLAYGMLLLSGDGVAVDKSQAFEWFGKAARQDNARAKEVLRELLAYRGQPTISSIKDPVTVITSGKHQNENPLRLEGKGVFLDQGTFALKFSMPTLTDAYAPQSQPAARPLLEKLQGGTFDIIFRTSQ
ncbi:MAG: SEL1-like repeat protein [Desulfuromonadales bacterium]|nr:SEL1-like repeat protein [Desulfuromonadales bacterium]